MCVRVESGSDMASDVRENVFPLAANQIAVILFILYRSGIMVNECLRYTEAPITAGVLFVLDNVVAAVITSSMNIKSVFSEIVLHDGGRHDRHRWKYLILSLEE